MTVGAGSPTVGVVGGGQLGRMLGEAAAPLGIELVVADPTPACPAAPVAREQLVGGFEDAATIRSLAERVDYLTYEIELVDPDALAAAGEATGTPVHPAPETLRLTQDKLAEKRRLESAGVPVADFRPVGGADELRRAAADWGFPVMLKARHGGYDGRGNVLVEGPGDVEPALETVAGPALVERFVEFDCECSVIGVRGEDEVATYPAGENVHAEEILRETVAPARVPAAVRERAQAVASDVLALLSGRGTIGVELFAVGGDVLVNEVAPRPHNSGHFTIEGAHASQFENHLRAVAGLPLGSTGLRGPTAMANVLGDVEAPRPAALDGAGRVLETPGAHLHWYGKREVRPLRKMGHVTVEPTAGEGPDALLDRARDLVDGLTFVHPAEPQTGRPARPDGDLHTEP